MAELVKIKLLKNTPLGNEGDVVEVGKPLAEQMCQYRKLHNGHGEVAYRTAMYLDEKVPEEVIETQGQALAAGKKNVVETPKEDAAPPAQDVASGTGASDSSKGNKKAKP
jgi:hypothetical protein